MVCRALLPLRKILSIIARTAHKIRTATRGAKCYTVPCDTMASSAPSSSNLTVTVWSDVAWYDRAHDAHARARTRTHAHARARTRTPNPHPRRHSHPRPWCWVSFQQLEGAIQQFGSRVDVIWKPFIIDPGTAPNGEDYQAYNERRWGSDGWTSSLRRKGREVGARFDNWVTWPNTLQCHRLMRWAGPEKHGALKEILFRKCYEQGANVSDLECLEKVANPNQTPNPNPNTNPNPNPDPIPREGGGRGGLGRCGSPSVPRDIGGQTRGPGRMPGCVEPGGPRRAILVRRCDHLSASK